MPVGEGPMVTAAEVLHIGDVHAGKSLHDEAAAASLNVADGHITLMHISEPEGDEAPPTPSRQSRAQRYNQRLRDRLEAREDKRKLTPRPIES
jgi:hypothetical protein